MPLNLIAYLVGLAVAGVIGYWLYRRLEKFG